MQQSLSCAGMEMNNDQSLHHMSMSRIHVTILNVSFTLVWLPWSKENTSLPEFRGLEASSGSKAGASLWEGPASVPTLG